MTLLENTNVEGVTQRRKMGKNGQRNKRKSEENRITFFPKWWEEMLQYYEYKI